MTRRLLALALWLPLAACSGQPAPAPSPAASAGAPAPAASTAAAPSTTPAYPPADGEGCEHLAKGPAAAITAVALVGTTAPAIASDHKRYDVTVAETGGWVKFESAAATEWVFYVAPDATLSVTDAGSKDVPLASSAKTTPACADVKGRYSAKLGVGVHYVKITPAKGQTKVGVVVEDANGKGGD